jgi:hypothetical protein
MSIELLSTYIISFVLLIYILAAFVNLHMRLAAVDKKKLLAHYKKEKQKQSGKKKTIKEQLKEESDGLEHIYDLSIEGKSPKGIKRSPQWTAIVFISRIVLMCVPILAF